MHRPARLTMLDTVLLLQKDAYLLDGPIHHQNIEECFCLLTTTAIMQLNAITILR